MLIFTALLFIRELLQNNEEHKYDIETDNEVDIDIAKTFIEIKIEIENDRDRAIFFQSSLWACDNWFLCLHFRPSITINETNAQK